MPTRINMKHPFQHVGTSQAARLVKALSSGHFRLDERSMQDLISAAHAYARMLRYHDSHDVTDPQQALSDNWTGFWEVENLTYMAILAAMDTDQIRRDYESIDAAFGEALDAASGKKSKKNASFEGQYFRQLLVFTQKTALKIEQHYLTLRDDIALKSELLRLIRRDNAFEYDPDDVEGAMHQLVGWHKAWDDELGATLYQPFRLTDGRWGIRSLDEYHCILPDSTLLDRDQIRGLFLRFFNILVVIKARAQQLFDAEMARLEKPEDEDPRPLAPHIALFITFLNLFRHAQDSLNDIPQRHLDFYYDQVLGLERRPASPDHAYLIFTLAKEFNQELIEKGTALLAGKDDKGQPIIFKTLEQWKVTKAEVAAVKAAYWHDTPNHKMEISVMPDHNVKYLGGEIDKKGKVTSWRGFADDSNLPLDYTGFAIASPQLILREGKRIALLDIQINPFELDESTIFEADFQVFLSTAKEWVKLEYDESLNQDESTDLDQGGQSTGKIGAFDLFCHINSTPATGSTPEITIIDSIKLRVVLEKDFEPIEKREGDEGICKEWPAIKVLFPPSWSERAIQFNEVEIHLKVDDIQGNLIIQTDQGIFDGTKTIFPFGPQPKTGNRFFVGSTEVFQKSLTKLDVDFGWIAPPDSFKTHYNHYSNKIPFVYSAPIGISLLTLVYDFENYYVPFVSPKLRVDFIDAAEATDLGSNYKVSTQVNDSAIKRDPGVATVMLRHFNGSEMGNANGDLTIDFNGNKMAYANGRFSIDIADLNTVTDFGFAIKSKSGKYAYQGSLGNNTPGNKYYFESVEVFLIPEKVALEPLSGDVTYGLSLSAPFPEVLNDKTKLKVTLGGNVVAASNIQSPDNGQFIITGTGTIATQVKVEYTGYQAVTINNSDLLTAFIIHLKPAIWPEASIREILAPEDNELGKLTIIDAFTKQAVSNIEVTIDGVALPIGTQSSIGLTATMKGKSVRVSNYQYEDAVASFPNDDTFAITKAYVLEISPVEVLCPIEIKPTDYLLSPLGESRVVVANTDAGKNISLTEQSRNDSIALYLPHDKISDNLKLTVSQSSAQFKSHEMTWATLKSLRSNTAIFTGASLSSIEVRLESVGDNVFDLVEKDKIVSYYGLNIGARLLNRDVRTQHFTEYSPTLKRGFLKFTMLENDFLHSEYPKLLSDQDNAGKINEPYTPAFNSLTLSYQSSQKIVKPQDGHDGFFHLTPFDGYAKQDLILPDSNQVKAFYLLPSLFAEPGDTHIDNQLGNLYIGLENLIAGDNLSLYIQMEEGSEKNFELLPPKPLWYYLSDNVWKAIDAEKVLRDTTQGFTRSGIVQLAIPTDATAGNTVLPAKHHWLAVKVIEGENDAIGAFPSIKSIRAQAIEAIFIPDEKKNDLARLNTPLPAQTISKLAQSRSAVKKVEQPYDSFGGLRPESDATEFYRRVSERLRHRDRAVTVWDYEHLLLEKYRSVAIAKCITHTRYEATNQYPNASEVAPGFVTMSVIPDLTRHPNMVREEPRFSRGDLTEMRDHLLPKTNLFLQPVEQDDVMPPLRTDYLQVVNPQYEPVHVLLTVWFKRGADVNLAKYQINEALRRLFAPWLYEANNGPVFGRSIRRSELVQLIESMDAVDVIETLEIFHLLEKSGATMPPTGSQPAWDSTAKNWGAWEPFRIVGTHIRPDNARSILTTVAKHTIVQGSTTESIGTPPVVKVITVAPRMAIAPPPEDEGEIPEIPVENPKKATAKPAAKTPKAPAKKRK